ncbi:MAG: hypothetical protein H7Z42_10080 [Roseiflexaceae bacterium]|nr:hypothetical protein [Roseiflexaceae bacterium]
MSSPNPNEARARLATTFRPGELIWLVGERYDAALSIWTLEILRVGNFGRWVQQRHSFDEAADVLYFLGETTLGDEEFRVAREKNVMFPKSSRQDHKA